MAYSNTMDLEVSMAPKDLKNSDGLVKSALKAINRPELKTQTVQKLSPTVAEPSQKQSFFSQPQPSFSSGKQLNSPDYNFPQFDAAYKNSLATQVESGLLKIALNIINEPDMVQNTSRAVLEPKRTINRLSLSKPNFSFGQQLNSPEYIFQQFHTAYKNSLATHIESGKSINFRDCHMAALKTAVHRVKYDFTIGAISVEPLLRSEILQLEQEATALEQAVMKKVREIEFSLNVNLLKSAHNSSVIIDSSTEAARLELSKIIAKCDTKRLEDLGKAFVEQQISLWKKSAAIIESYYTAMKKLLKKRVYLTNEDLHKEHESISQSARAKSVKSASTFLEMILVALYHRFKADNKCNRVKVEMLHETAVEMSLVAYKKTMSDALELTVFTPEALFNIHETTSISVLKAYSELKSDHTSSLWKTFEKKLQDQMEVEFDLFEELNKFNAFEVEQRGETVVAAAMDTYKTRIGDKTEERAHAEAKEKALVTFDNLVKDDVRREAVHMWRQKLTSAIHAHYLKAKAKASVLLRLKDGGNTQKEAETNDSSRDRIAELLPDSFLKLNTKYEPQSTPLVPFVPSTSRRRDLDNALKRVGAKLPTTEASFAVVGQVRKVVQETTEVLNRREASDAEIDVAVRKLELWEKSLDKSNA